jgi:hypothetical protein
VELAQV